MRSALKGLGLLALVTAAGGAVALAAQGCSSDNGPSVFDDGGGGGGEGGGGEGGLIIGTNDGGTGFLPDGRVCDNLECKQVSCPSGGKTTFSGVVFDPAGKVPVFNAIVYVPNRTPKAITTGASCDTCSGTAFDPLVSTLTDSKGHFSLENVPVMANMPLVVQIGKWRRIMQIPQITACQDNPANNGDIRLPRNTTEGDLPQIAITTGGADPLECLLRKIGVADSEFDIAGGPGRIHLYAGQGYTETADGGTVQHPADSAFAPTFHGGTAFPDATAFWSDLTKLKAYDILLMACEGQQLETNKPLAARQNLTQFEAAGGRVFASHWHDQWFDKEAPTLGIASWITGDPEIALPPQDPANGTIDTSFPKGQDFKDWLSNTGSLNADQTITIKQAKENVTAVTPDAGAQGWITIQNQNASNQTVVESLTFNTPIGTAPAQQCGRVVYSDLHVSGGPGDATGDHPGQPFPSGCVTTDLSPQEKALEFMLFDLSSCIQSDTSVPTPPR